MRPVALDRGPSWPGGGSARPRSNIFCLWNKTGKWYARLDHPGGARRRGVSRRMSRGHSKPPPSRGASYGSWDSEGHRGHVPARVTGRISPGAGGSTGGARIVVSGLGSPARCLRLFSQTPAPQRVSRSVTCLQVSTGFCQLRGAAPPGDRPRRWQLPDRESGRAGGMPGSRASRARRAQRLSCAPGG